MTTTKEKLEAALAAIEEALSTYQIPLTAKICETLAILNELKKEVADENPIAWLVDWPDTPDLGRFFCEKPTNTGRNRPLYKIPTRQWGDLTDGEFAYATSLGVIEGIEYACEKLREKNSHDKARGEK